ncbi:MAG: hypothetical protein JXO51_09720 [Candidatus Aminicenantes bacterium]|nr:hypothetical protein [Candidatus Aminicenantes bacterium]
MKKYWLLLQVLIFVGGAFSIHARSITVTSPNGGERWALGSRQNITWSHEGIAGSVRINLVRLGGAVAGTIATVPVADGRYPWTVGALASGSAPAGDYLIGLFVSREDVDDRSDAAFAIVGEEAPPSPGAAITVTSPNGGENWVLGSSQRVRWTSRNLAAGTALDIELLKGNVVKGKIAPAVPASAGSCAWSPAGTLSDGTVMAAASDYSVRVRPAGRETPFDFSDRPFALGAAGPQPGPQPPPEGLPDLVVTDLFLSSEGCLQATVANTGSAAFAGSVLLRFWENEGTVPFETTRELALLPGQSQNVNLVHRVVEPENSCGMYYSVFVDAARRVSEGTEENNSYAEKIFTKTTCFRLLARIIAGKRGNTRIIVPSTPEVVVTPAMVDWPINLRGRDEYDRCLLPLEFTVRNCGTRQDLLPASLKLYQLSRSFTQSGGFKDVGRFSKNMHVASGSIESWRITPAVHIVNPGTLRICLSEHFTWGGPFWSTTQHEQFNCIEVPLRFEGFERR